MSVKVRSIDGDESEEVGLPSIFEGPVRPDIIRKAVISSQSSRIQPKGANPRAGMETTAETPPKGSGQTRVKRVQGQGYSAAGQGAWAPFTRGGRRAHPPKAEEKDAEGMNKKEKVLAVSSAISATKDGNLVESRGHKVDGIEDFPIVVEDDFEEMKKTREVKEALENLGVWPDVERVKDGRKTRAGKGKMRGRRYRGKVGPLIVIDENRGIFRGARNIPGVDVVLVDDLNTEALAPGGEPARLTIWTKGALEKLERRFSG